MSARTQRESTRHGHSAGVADAEQPCGHPQHRGSLRRAASDPHGWRRAGRAVYHDIGECDARAKSRAKRLEHCLLGCEPSGQTFDPIGGITDLVEFGLNETAWYQRITGVLDPAPQLSDLNHIYSMSDDIHAGQQAPDCAVPFAGLSPSLLAFYRR